MITTYVLSIGVLNITTGKTHFDWSVYETWDSSMTAYLTRKGSLLFAAGETFNIGDQVELRGNDTQRKLATDSIVDKAPCVKEALLVMLKNNGYDYYPLRAFAARAKGNRKLKTSYSVKGTVYGQELV
jgi:hypothetical protein